MATSSSTSSQILSIAPYHQSLLQTLNSLQYAPSALAQQTSYLRDLEAELKKVQQTVKQLGEKTKKERKEHEELRDSTTRRLAARIKGKSGVEKYQAKKEKEEREYVEALENEMRERGKQTMLDNMIQEAKKVKADLEQKSQQLEQTKREISNLYHQVFDGPTMEFPQDDALEQELATAQATYDRIQAILNSHSQSVNLLAQADQMLGMALQKMDDALGYSTWDVYGGGSLSDMMERDALANAAVFTAKAEMLLNQAQRTSSDVQPIGSLRVHDISLIGDVFFDNIFSDIRAHHKIQNNRTELAAAHGRLRAQLRAARQRAQLAGADLVEASEVLAECNKALDTYRQEVFLRIASGNNSQSEFPDLVVGDLPPGYGETSSTTHVSSETLAERMEGLRLSASSTALSPTTSPQYPPPPGPPPSGQPPETIPSTSESMARIPSMKMPEPSVPSFQVSDVSNPSASLYVPSSSSYSEYAPSTRRSPSRTPLPHRRSRSSIHVPHLDSSSSFALSPNSSGNGMRRSRSSISTPSSPFVDSFDVDQELPPDPQSTPAGDSIQYSPPPGPPPSSMPRSTTETTEGDSSDHSSQPKHSVPTNWGSKNPFAAMMMIG